MSKKNDIFSNRYSYANGDKANIVVSDDFEDISSKDTKKKKKSKKAMIISLVSIFTVFALIIGLWWYVFGGMQKVLIDKTNSNLGIDDNFKYKGSGVTNIALFGIDASSNNTSRSDTIMVVSVNRKKGTIKVSSILRDSYVAIDLPNGNQIHEKLTHAYHYGCVYQNQGYQTSGPELAIKTINQNFDLDIRDYVAVNFQEAAEVVDYLGGVDITITEAERKNMNAMEWNKLVRTGNEVTQTGLVHLNGMQACQYSRIRMIDSDNERTNRQGKVLERLLEKVKDLSITQYPSFIKAMLSIVQTSMDYSTILGFTPLLSSDLALQRISFPQTTDPDKPYYMQEGHEVIGGMYEGAWVWRFDTDAVATYMHNFIYETDIEVDPVDYSNQPTYNAKDDDDDDDQQQSSRETSSEQVSSEEVSSAKVSSEQVSSTAISSAQSSSHSTSSKTPSIAPESSQAASSEEISSVETSSEEISSEEISSVETSSEQISSEETSSVYVASEVSEVASLG